MHSINLFNIQVMRQRNRGDIWDVDSSGQLVSLQGVRRAAYRLGIGQSEVKMRVQAAISKALEALDLYDDEGVKGVLDHIKPLGLDLYDRTKIPVRVLQAQFGDLFVAGFSPETVDGTAPPAGHFTQVLKTIQLANELGIGPVKYTGSCRKPLMFRGLDGRVLMVGKTSEESPRFVSRFSGFFGTHTWGFYNAEQEAKNEVAASLLSEGLALNNVPETRMVTLTLLDGTEFTGTGQLFVHGAKMAKGGLRESDRMHQIHLWILTLFAFLGWTRKEDEEVCQYEEEGVDFTIFGPKELVQTEFEKMVILDFLLGNLDRHFHNWMIDPQSGHIIAIDNGKAVLDRYSESAISLHNQYVWRLLPQAKQPFSEESLRSIHLVYHRRHALIHQLLSEGLIGHAQSELMLERFEMLYTFATTGREVYDLGVLRTAEDFERARQEHGLPPKYSLLSTSSEVS